MKIYAPFPAEHVKKLNEWQNCDHVHPFTCSDRSLPNHDEYATSHGQKDIGILVATEHGWVCQVPDCDYTQNWAHDFMLEIPGNPLHFFFR